MHTTIRIFYLDRAYDIDVVDVQPNRDGAICILDADVNTEFEAPPDYVDEPAPQKQKEPSGIPAG